MLIPLRTDVTATPSSSNAVMKTWMTNLWDCLFSQGTPTSKTTVVTLTVAELLTKIILGTPSAGNTAYTLPTGALMDSGCPMSAIDQGFEWSIINLAAGANTITLTNSTVHTIVGNPLIAINSSAKFFSRRTAAGVWVTYRVAG